MFCPSSDCERSSRLPLLVLSDVSLEVMQWSLQLSRPDGSQALST